jgi:hypothetical protein
MKTPHRQRGTRHLFRLDGVPLPSDIPAEMPAELRRRLRDFLVQRLSGQP